MSSWPCSERRSLVELFRPLAAKTSPLARQVPAPIRRKAHGIQPGIMAQVAFTEFTADGMVRHPTFRGIRDDKAASDVTPEVVAHSKRKRPVTRGWSSAPGTCEHGVFLSRPDQSDKAHLLKTSTRNLSRFSVAPWREVRRSEPCPPLLAFPGPIPHQSNRPLCVSITPRTYCMIARSVARKSAPSSQRGPQTPGSFPRRRRYDGRLSCPVP